MGPSRCVQHTATGCGKTICFPGKHYSEKTKFDFVSSRPDSTRGFLGMPYSASLGSAFQLAGPVTTGLPTIKDLLFDFQPLGHILSDWGQLSIKVVAWLHPNGWIWVGKCPVSSDWDIINHLSWIFQFVSAFPPGVGIVVIRLAQGAFHACRILRYWPVFGWAFK